MQTPNMQTQTQICFIQALNSDISLMYTHHTNQCGHTLVIRWNQYAHMKNSMKVFISKEWL